MNALIAYDQEEANTGGTDTSTQKENANDEPTKTNEGKAGSNANEVVQQAGPRDEAAETQTTSTAKKKKHDSGPDPKPTVTSAAALAAMPPSLQKVAIRNTLEPIIYDYAIKNDQEQHLEWLLSNLVTMENTNLLQMIASKPLLYTKVDALITAHMAAQEQHQANDMTTTQGVTLTENPDAPARAVTPIEEQRVPYLYPGHKNDEDKNSNTEWAEARPYEAHNERPIQGPRFLSDKTRYGKKGQTRRVLTNEAAKNKGRPEHKRKVGEPGDQNPTEAEAWTSHLDSEQSSGNPSSPSDDSATEYIELDKPNYIQYAGTAYKTEGRAQLTAFRSIRHRTKGTRHAAQEESSSSRTHTKRDPHSDHSCQSLENSDGPSHSDTEQPLPANAKFFFREQAESEIEDASDGNTRTIHKSRPSVVLKPRGEPRCKLTPAQKPQGRKSGDHLTATEYHKEPADNEPHRRTQRKRTLQPTTASHNTK